jgi:hypothetical protein
MQQRQGTLRSTMMATPSADAGPRQRALLLRPGLRPARDLPAGSNLRSFDASWHKRRRERLCSPKVHGLMRLRGKHTIKHINHVFVRPSRRKAVTAFHSYCHTSARPRLFVFAVPRRAKAQSQQ